jgi:hypothetical protein
MVDNTPMTASESAIARQYALYQETEAKARKLWDKKDRELLKLVRLAKLGRKSQIVVAISENRGIRITDQWRTAMRERAGKIFTRAFNHRHEVKEVPLDSAP